MIRKLAEAERHAQAMSEENANLALELKLLPSAKQLHSVQRQVLALQRQLARAKDRCETYDSATSASEDLTVGETARHMPLGPFLSSLDCRHMWKVQALIPCSKENTKRRHHDCTHVHIQQAVAVLMCVNRSMQRCQACRLLPGPAQRGVESLQCRWCRWRERGADHAPAHAQRPGHARAGPGRLRGPAT